MRNRGRNVELRFFSLNMQESCISLLERERGGVRNPIGGNLLTSNRR